jgi:hypothetical protein
MQSSARKIMRVLTEGAHGALIAGQVALTLILLAGPGGALQALARLTHTPLGHDSHNVLPVWIPLHDGVYTTLASHAEYFERVRAKLAEIPGVTETAISTNAVPPQNGSEMPFEIPRKPSSEQTMARVNVVGPGYFPTLRIPLVQGRVWTETENCNAAHVAVINQTIARVGFPDGDALGHSLKLPDG